MQEAEAGRYAFGAFVLDVGAGELRRDGAAVELRPKLFTLLVYLVANAGRLISKEELLDAVWEGLFVSSGALNRSIAELREVLGDDARSPALIETVSRRGYKFIAAVTVEMPQEQAWHRRSPFLVVHGGHVTPLRVGENVVGRMPDCDVQIVATSVSRRHARITVSSLGATVEDLGSTNGTFLHEERVTGPAILHAGDEIRLGSERLRFVGDAGLRARTEPL